MDAIKSGLTRRVLDMLAKLAAEEPRIPDFWKEFGDVIKEGPARIPPTASASRSCCGFDDDRRDSGARTRSLADYRRRQVRRPEARLFPDRGHCLTSSSSPHLEHSARKDRGPAADRSDRPVDREPPDRVLRQVAQRRGPRKLDLLGEESTPAVAADDDRHKGLLKKLRRLLKERVETVNVSRTARRFPAMRRRGGARTQPAAAPHAGGDRPGIAASRPISEINADHPLAAKLAAEADETRFAELAHILVDPCLAGGRVAVGQSGGLCTTRNRSAAGVECIGNG